MNTIMLAILIVAALGLIAGLGLSVASALMAVPKDEKAEQIEEILPGANCGACGYSGCSGYAKALSKGVAALGLCSPGGESVVRAVSEILGTEPSDVEYKTALVHCIGSLDNTENCTNYQGIESCRAVAQLYAGEKDCSYGCIGKGDCLNSCEYGAISICNGVAKIDPKKCKGCSKCVKACPKNLISFVPLKKQAVVRCMNCDKGAVTNKNCKVGCIGCMQCVKVCEYGAIEVKNFVAKVDAKKCIGCGKCVDVCKRGCITLFDV